MEDDDEQLTYIEGTIAARGHLDTKTYVEVEEPTSAVRRIRRACLAMKDTIFHWLLDPVPNLHARRRRPFSVCVSEIML